MKKGLFIAKILLSLVGAGLIFGGCAAKKEETSSNNFTTTAANNLSIVSQSFSPASLQSSTSLLSYEKSSDPCANTDLFGCQPILLRLYMDIAKVYFDSSRNLISGIGQNLGDLADGASGTHVDGTQSILYSKTSATVFSVLATNTASGKGQFLHVTANGSTYNIKMDTANLPADSSSESSTNKIDITVTYTDADTWGITILVTDGTCSASDPRAPERVRIKVSKANGLWTGKAQLYNGIWLTNVSNNTSPDCNTTVTDDTAMNMYTDFVADSVAAKANVYMVKRNVTDFDTNSSAYSLDKLCDNYYANFGAGDASTCNSAFTMLANYKNSFCNLASTTTAKWNDDCSTDSSTVSAASFGATSDWTLPNAFYQESITLPTSLSFIE